MSKIIGARSYTCGGQMTAEETITKETNTCDYNCDSHNKYCAYYTDKYCGEV